MTLSIMVVDDHRLFRQGLISLLHMGQGMHVVAEAEDARQAIDLHRQHRPDVTLMDLRLPGPGGVDAIVAIRQEAPSSRFVVLTTYDGDEDIHRALCAGAQGYLLKDVSWDDLVDAIEAVHAGERCIPPELARKVSARLPGSDLTERELAVLRSMAEGKSNKEIGEDLRITERTVKGHVNNLLGKLGVTARTHAVVTALQRGLVHLD